MANIGIGNASYYADNSISRLNRQVSESVEKVSSNKSNVTNGDKSSLVSMDNTFKLDLAATNAAVKNMSVAQAYLSTAISTLDNASAILAKIHELAVLGANGSNSDADNAAINTESEALIDAFHKSMTVAQFKGKEVFTDEPSSFSLASGGRSNSIQFGVGQVDYDVLYDYTNPGLTSLSSGVKYEIKRDLTGPEKAAILSRSSKLTADQLVKGFQFTTDAAPTGNTGDGTITINPNGTNIHNYAKGSGVQRFDAAATANGLTADFKSGFVEVEITENYELTDNLSLKTAGNITVNNDGVVFFQDAAKGQTIEIGKVDDTKNGQNGTTLRINFHADATIPGTSNIVNGDFSTTMQEVLSYTEQFRTQNRTENRNGFISTFNDKDGNAINMGAIADANRTYKNVTLAYKPGQAGTAGAGTVRAHIKTAIDGGGNETITNMEIIDGGKNFANNEILLIPAGNGNIAGQEITITGLQNNGYTHTLTEAITQDTTQNATWPNGTAPGQYNFAADGTPAVGGNNLTYVANDVKKRQVVNVVQVNDTWPGGTAPGQYNFAADGTPAVGGNNLTYAANDVKKQQVVTTTRVGENDVTSYSIANVTVGQNQYSVANVTEVSGTTYLGERNLTETVSNGFLPNEKTVASNWTRYMGRVDFGSNFTISEFANQANDNLNQGNGTIDTAPRVEYSVPTPTEAQMAQPSYAGNDPSGNPASPAVRGNDDTGVASVVSNSDITVPNGTLKLNTGEFRFNQGFGTFHGPAAVSDVFAADQGDFLKLDYTAQGVYDDYHVAGYIYEVNPDGSAKSAPIMALNETGTTVNSRASVEVPETGNYRFVFIVGTHDKTGGLLAGADMVIDNIVAEEPYTISTGAVGDLLKAIHFENNANAANPNKTLVTKVSNQDGSTILTDDALINMQNFELTSEPDGPYMLAPTLNFTTQPSEGGTGSAVVLTKKIETVQDRLNIARTQAGSQYGALEEAINITTDLRSQFALGSGTLSDLNFSIETVNLTRRQMQQDVATTVLAQANKSQSSLVSLVDGSYRSYLNS